MINTGKDTSQNTKKQALRLIKLNIRNIGIKKVASASGITEVTVRRFLIKEDYNIGDSTLMKIAQGIKKCEQEKEAFANQLIKIVS